MNNQPTAFFFEIQSIPDDTILFDQFQQQNIFYSYFQVEQNYYLFVSSQKFIDIDSIDPFIHIIQELDTKQRKIRSLRGFFLYALEIFERTNNSQILKTNLKPSFWRNLKSILRQNKKTVLLQFLFGRGYSYPPSSSHFEDQIQTLKNQVNSLQERIAELENRNLVMEGKLNMLSAAPRSSKFDTSTLKGDHTTFNQEKGLNQANFIILGNLSEEEKIEILKTGFRLNQEGKISLKKYYETKDQYSLFQLKGYSIKYESIRRTKLYQQLNPLKQLEL
jgi:hypothetical protein